MRISSIFEAHDIFQRYPAGTAMLREIAATNSYPSVNGVYPVPTLAEFVLLVRDLKWRDVRNKLHGDDMNHVDAAYEQASVILAEARFDAARHVGS